MTRADLPPAPVSRPRAAGREGFALMMVLVLILAIGALAVAAIALGGNTSALNLLDERQDALETVADAGIETARSRLNSSRAVFPDSGYVTLENGVTPTDAAGKPIAGMKRWTYAGPIGVTTGQYGIFGSIVSVAQAANGDRVVRREDVTQESFAKYAYFTDVEPATISFGGGDQIQGPVHTNDYLKIYSSGATFKGPGQVTTARQIQGRQYGTFLEGYQENVARIDLPPTTELTRLQAYAAAGGSAFTEPAGGNATAPRMRIEFLWIDVNGNGAADADEGFFRVFVSPQQFRLMATQPGGGWVSSDQCGWWNAAARRFESASDSTVAVNAAAGRRQLVHANPTSRCYMEGDPTITDSVFVAGSASVTGRGWIARGFALAGAPPALTGRPDYAYLFPLSHSRNANFKGVIHVSGSVAISGVVRGRVTIAATGNIFIADDLKYAIPPGGSAGDCTDADMVGMFAGNNVIVADNALNTPQQIDPGANAPFVPLDDSNTGLELQGVILALNQFTVQNFNTGPTATNWCGSVPWGRGCLLLSGGVIQQTRGPVGQSNGTGFLKRYSYDVCAAKKPPPYFPTTGRFSRSLYYELDPVGFSVGRFFASFSAG